MKKIFVVLLIMTLMVSTELPCLAQKSSADILRAGLLGAGAGALGGAASGAKGSDVWKGALAGVGVNIIGGALLDAISGESVQRENYVVQMRPQDAYSTGYQEGYYNGYKAGYAEGLRDGIKEGMLQK
ncbi:MAG: hypothetical protein WBD24_05185 [Candidatus Omnitrophota bacterium]